MGEVWVDNWDGKIFLFNFFIAKWFEMCKYATRFRPRGR